MNIIAEYLINLLLAIGSGFLIFYFYQISGILRKANKKRSDEIRNIKVDVLLKVVYEAIDVSIRNYYNRIGEDVKELETFDQLVDHIKQEVGYKIPNDIIEYLVKVFIPDWDEWLGEIVFDRMNNFSSVVD